MRKPRQVETAEEREKRTKDNFAERLEAAGAAEEDLDALVKRSIALFGA